MKDTKHTPQLPVVDMTSSSSLNSRSFFFSLPQYTNKLCINSDRTLLGRNEVNSGEIVRQGAAVEDSWQSRSERVTHTIGMLVIYSYKNRLACLMKQTYLNRRRRHKYKEQHWGIARLPLHYT